MWQERKKRRADAWNSCQETIDKIKKDYSAKIRSLREEKHAAEAEKAMIPSQVSHLEMELAQTREAEKAWRESELAKTETALAELAVRKERAENNRNALARERDKRIQDSYRQREAQKKELESVLQFETAKISEQTSQR